MCACVWIREKKVNDGNPPFKSKIQQICKHFGTLCSAFSQSNPFWIAEKKTYRYITKFNSDRFN